MGIRTKIVPLRAAVRIKSVNRCEALLHSLACGLSTAVFDIYFYFRLAWLNMNKISEVPLNKYGEK